jgi:phosphoglucosamine mutase
MPTPAIAYLTDNMRCDAGIMISASHNSFEDNGIKFFDARGNKFSEEVEAQIEAIYYDDEQIAKAQMTGKAIGSSKRIDDVIGRYIVQLKNSFPSALSLQGLRIVLDTANGAGYKVGPTVLEELGAEVIVLHNGPDGFNINEGCGALHPKDVQKAVKKYRADIGFALDGDADRLVVIDEQGEVVDGDQLLGALGLFMHKFGMLKGDGIVATVMSNQALEDALVSAGLKLYRCGVGDKYVLETMREHGLNFGGEQSGHVIMQDFAKTGDGLVTALQVLAMVLMIDGKASEALRPFELYPQKLINLNVKTKKPLESIAGLDQELSDVEAAGMRHLIRYSGTENKLRILLEGRDRDAMLERMERLSDFFRHALND